MNPLTLLIKPMIAAGLFVTKMLVAVGYMATDGHDPGLQQKAAAEQVRVAVVPSESGLQSMEMEMANGELFELASAAVPSDSDESSSDRSTRPFRKRAQTGSQPDVVAMLESTLGRTMRCDVSLPHSTEHGSAHCTVDAGESYDVTF